MKSWSRALVISGLLAFSSLSLAADLPQTTAPMPEMTEAEKANVAVVYGFMKALNEQKTEAATEPFVADEFKSHNPAIDGKKGLVGFASYLAKNHPKAQIKEWLLVYAKDDLVTQHYLYSHDGEKVDAKIVDIMRVKNGKIVEYWDSVQELKN